MKGMKNKMRETDDEEKMKKELSERKRKNTEKENRWLNKKKRWSRKGIQRDVKK